VTVGLVKDQVLRDPPWTRVGVAESHALFAGVIPAESAKRLEVVCLATKLGPCTVKAAVELKRQSARDI